MLKKITLLLVILGILSCEEIIEVDDISEEEIIIIAPTDNAVIQADSINFFWEVLEFGESYQLRIATPNFETPQQIVEDTLITTNNFTLLLPANNYQWQVKAINSAYQTQFQTQNLTVEE
nr:hypothetical protein [uncultured Psychroserpens sp.]